MKIETKIPFYNIVNMFLTGLVFVGVNFLIFSNHLGDLGEVLNIGNIGLETIIVLSFLALTYEVGYILFRIGATVVEPILKATKLVEFGSYADFNDCRKENPFLDTLSREYAAARTQIATFLILMITALVMFQWLIFGLSLVIITIFILTARTHSKKINDVVKKFKTTQDGVIEEQ